MSALSKFKIKQRCPKCSHAVFVRFTDMRERKIVQCKWCQTHIMIVDMAGVVRHTNDNLEKLAYAVDKKFNLTLS